MSDADNSELVTQFCNVTGVDASRAKFYLESSAWKINVALGSFYDAGDGGDFEPEIIEPEDNVEMQEESKKEDTDRSDQKEQARNTKKMFATIASLDDDCSSDDSEKGQAFYAGGSENSGQQVLGPPRKKPQDLIKEIMTSAQSHGAESIDRSAESEHASRSGATAFSGFGFTLGASSSDSKLVGTTKGTNKPLPPVDVVMKLWQNGFSVDDGPLRDFRDPENAEFLRSITMGEIPQELIKGAKNHEINLDMEDHKTELYHPPQRTLKPFSGQGHVLGSPAAEVVVMPPPSESSKSISTAPVISVNESEPTTNIQIRLADGSRLVTKLNHHHTIQDIRNYIITTRPEYANSTFVLMTTFPNKELTDDSKSIAEANLLNAVIVQRISS